MRHIDTLSTIYRHIFHSKLPTKSSFVEEKMVKIGNILSRKSSKDPSCLAMCNVYFRNKLPTGLLARLMPFSIRVTSCRYKLAMIFTCRLCIDIAISNQHVVSFHEYSDNRYFWQSITALIYCIELFFLFYFPLVLPCKLWNQAVMSSTPPVPSPSSKTMMSLKAPSIHVAASSRSRWLLLTFHL